MGEKVGYVRVSTKGQNDDRQLTIMKEQGVKKVFKEKVSGKSTNDRKEFQKMMDYVREGDTLIIESYSRLARSTRDLLNIVDSLHQKGVNLISVKEQIDTTTPTGKLLFTIMAGISEFEREIMLQRQGEGIIEAQKNGVKFGRPKVEYPDRFLEVYEQWKKGEITGVKAYTELELTRATFYRLVAKHEGREVK